VVEFLGGIIEEIRVAMLCVGAPNLAVLKKIPLVRRDPSGYPL